MSTTTTDARERSSILRLPRWSDHERPRRLHQSRPSAHEPVLLYGGSWHASTAPAGSAALATVLHPIAEWLVGVDPDLGPLARDVAEEGHPSGQEASGSLQPKELAVLLVGDEPRFQATLKRRLEVDGHRAVVAPDGRTALALLTLARWDLVCLPWQLSDTSGLHLAELIRARQPGCFTALMSNCPEGIGDVARRSRSIDAVLPRPWRAVEFRRVLVRAHARRARNRAGGALPPDRPA